VRGDCRKGPRKEMFRGVPGHQHKLHRPSRHSGGEPEFWVEKANNGLGGRGDFHRHQNQMEQVSWLNAEGKAKKKDEEVCIGIIRRC